MARDTPRASGKAVPEESLAAGIAAPFAKQPTGRNRRAQQRCCHRGLPWLTACTVPLAHNTVARKRATLQTHFLPQILPGRCVGVAPTGSRNSCCLSGQRGWQEFDQSPPASCIPARRGRSDQQRWFCVPRRAAQGSHPSMQLAPSMGRAKLVRSIRGPLEDTQEGSCPGVAQLRHHYLYALAPASRTGVEPTGVGSRHGTQVVGHLGFSARRCAGHPRARQPRHRRSTAPRDPVVRTRTFSRPHLPCSGHGHGPRVVGRSILGGGVVHRGSDRPWRR
jgi:hypothetical protein